MPKLQPETLPRPVFLIDADGTHRGVVPVEVAREIAAERGMDLVEIAPLANPPGMRIMARSAYQYEDPGTRG